MKKYECVIVFDGLLSDEEIKTLQERIEQILTSSGSEITAVHPWGKRRLAYKVNKRTEGYYVLYYFTAADSDGVLPELERFCRIEEKILRHLVCHEVPSQFSKIMAEEKKKASEEERKEAREAQEEESPPKPEKAGETETSAPATSAPQAEEEPEKSTEQEKTSEPEKELSEKDPSGPPRQPAGEISSQPEAGEPEKAPSPSQQEQATRSEESSNQETEPEKKE